MNDVLLITNDNRVYFKNNETEKLDFYHQGYLTDDEILGICSKFIESKRDLALENKLVVTITSSDEGYEVGFAPLTLNLPEVKKVQGELPVELFIRYGRHLVFNDFNALLQRLNEYKKEN